MGEECKGGKEIQPMSQERRHGGGKPGRAAVNGAPDSGGTQSLIGAIDIALLLRYFSVQLKRPFKIPIPYWQWLCWAALHKGRMEYHYSNSKTFYDTFG
jgi:hypothetical protein